MLKGVSVRLLRGGGRRVKVFGLWRKGVQSSLPRGEKMSVSSPSCRVYFCILREKNKEVRGRFLSVGGGDEESQRLWEVCSFFIAESQ